MQAPAVTVDVVLFKLTERRLQVLFVRRGRPPFEGMWALPGGFVEANEPLEVAARRELEEETGLREVYLEQLHTFGDPGRDPRGWVISIAYLGLARPSSNAARAGDDAMDVAWFPVTALPALAFDHARMVALAQQRLQRRVRDGLLIFYLLPPCFTLSELQTAYETVLGEPLDKRNFRRKALRSGLLCETGELRTGEGRPAKRYTLCPDAETVWLRRLGLG